MTGESLDWLELEQSLRNAIPQNQLAVHYQAQVQLATARIVGMEALARWEHPTRGFVSPALFIRIAEESGLIHHLGAWVLMEATRQLAEWRRSGYSIRVAVNVSALQFRSEGFVDLVKRCISENEIDPAALELELTERSFLYEQSTAGRTLAALKHLGVGLAVDDFGTGYSSLSHLSRLPLDCLKIDRSLVGKAAEAGRDGVVAQVILSLGRALGLRVVADGVETAAQARFLMQHQCDEAQGHLFAKPGPAEAASRLIAARTLQPQSQDE
jgi:EAL domain-containing protein (putative c-di-GMP-specific phosphodiesterase class I)